MANGSLMPSLMRLLLLSTLCADICESRRSQLFSASLPGRCPSPPCECTADELNRKQVTCSTGSLLVIPVDKMDKEIQVLNITAPEGHYNHIALGRIFLDLHQLEEVHITYSNLPAIGDSSFWPGRALKLLNLSHNSISIVRDSDFNRLDNLVTLDLSDNHLSRAPSAAFRHLTNLTSLSLARNLFTKLVPRLFYKLERLEVLDLSGNPLREITAEDLKDIKTLLALNLSKCLLERIHSLVYKGLSNLTFLDLSDNQFMYLSSNHFTSLTSLRELRLNGNKLSVLLDNTFSGLKGLDFLDLSYNHISSMTSCAFCNTSITRLDISDNRFTSFQSRSLEPLSESLVELEVHSNRHLIDSTTSASHLIQPLKKLNHLSMAFNSLDDTLTESTFHNLESLLSLNLSHNRFVNISARLLAPLINLQVLDVSHNQIYGLGYSLFNQINSLTKLKTIYLNDNPWSCYRCHIMPVMDWIDSSPNAYFNVCHRYSKELSRLKHCIKCSTPSPLSAKYLHLINEFDLEWCSDPRVQLRLTASEPQIGLILAIFIIFSLIFVIIAVVLFYRKQGAVYYTHEDDRYDEKPSVAPVFSVVPNTAVKQPFHSHVHHVHSAPVRPSYPPHPYPPPSPHPSPNSNSPLLSKPESPKAGPSKPIVVTPMSTPLPTPGAMATPLTTSLVTPLDTPLDTSTTTTTMRIIRPKVQIYI